MIGNHYPLRTLAAVVLAAAVVSMSSGCVWTPELSRVKNDIERQLPDVRFDKEFSLSLGPVSLAFARLITRVVPDANEASSYLADVSRVQVAVYNTESLHSTRDVRMPEHLREMGREGWETAVRVREDDNVVWVMYRIDGDTVSDLYVVVLDDEQLVIVKAQGHLERLVARALKDSGGVRGIPRMHENDDDAM